MCGFVGGVVLDKGVMFCDQYGGNGQWVKCGKGFGNYFFGYQDVIVGDFVWCQVVCDGDGVMEIIGMGCVQIGDWMLCLCYDCGIG